MSVRETLYCAPESQKSLELLAHRLNRVVDVAVSTDGLAKLANPHIILFENVVPHKLGGGLIVVERHCVDDGLLKGIRVLLSDNRRVRDQTAHIFTDIVDRFVAMVDEVLLSDGRNDPAANGVPLRGKALPFAFFNEVAGGQNLSSYDESAEDSFVAFGSTGFDRQSDGHRRAPAFRVGKSERYVGSGLFTFSLIFS